MPTSMFPEEHDQFYSDLYSAQPMAAPQPGALQGVLSSPFTGIASGEGKIGELAGTAVAQSYKLVLKAEQTAAPWSPALQEMNPDELQQNVDQHAADYLRATRADPQTTGVAGQVIHNFADVATRMVAAPEAAVGAVVAGTTEFPSAQREFEAQGIDKETATQLAAAQSVLTGAGALLPGGVGARAAIRIPSGATINLAVGAASRYNTHQVLADAGYDQQAAQYRVLDGQSMATDLILGSFFGWMHKPEQPFGTPKIPQDVVDAGLLHLQERQAEIDLAPGVPTTPEARNDHVTTLNDTVEAVSKGEPVPEPVAELPEGTGTTPQGFIDNPAQDAARDAATAEQGKATAEGVDGLLSASKKANEPPKTTEQWVAEQINKEKAAAKVESLEKMTPEQKAKLAESTVDPETQSAIDMVQAAMKDDPGLHDFDVEVEDPVTGEVTTMKASDALDEMTDLARNAKNEGTLHEIAAACAFS